MWCFCGLCSLCSIKSLLAGIAVIASSFASLLLASIQATGVCNYETIFNFNLLSIFHIILSILILLPTISILLRCDGWVMGKIKEIFLFGKLKQPLNTTDHCCSRNSETKPTENTSTSLWRLWSYICSVPKRWFLHFYAFGVVVHGAVFMVALVLPLAQGSKFDTPLASFITWLQWPCFQKGLECSAYPVFTVFILEGVQMSRRLYECVWVSKFSPGTMSVFHYILGLIFYGTFGVGLLSSVRMELLVFPEVLPIKELMAIVTGVLIFIGASVFQHKSMVTFAALRSGVKEKSDGHHIPRGHLFRWVSCPHYLCEILIYTSFCVMFGGRNNFLMCVAVFVLTNQMCAGLLSHRWYTSTFPAYPKERKAIIPYLL